MMQRRRDDNSGATSTQLPLEIILPVAASVVFLLVLALVFVHHIYRKLDAQAKSVLHSPSLLVMSDLEANRQWLNGLKCLKCLGLGRPKNACSFGLEVKCRGEGAFDDDDDDDMPSPTVHALPQNVFFPKGRPSQLSCTTSWFQKNSSYYGCISPGAKSLLGGEAVPDIQITVPMTAANEATPPFLQNRRWTRAFKHDLGLVNGGMRSRTEIPSECSPPLRCLGPRRRVTSAPRALFNLRLARSAALPTITEARESCCSSESGAIKGFVDEASMSKIENRVTAAAGLAPESTLPSITSLPLIVSQPLDEEPRLRLSHSSSALGLCFQHARDISCGGSCAARNAPSDGTDRLIVASDSVVDSTAIECFSSTSADDDEDSRPSLLPHFDSGLASTAACISISSSCCSRSRRLSSGTSDLAYSGCSINNASAGAMPTSVVPATYDCAAAPSVAGPSHDAGNNRGSLLSGLAGVELWIDEDVDLFYYVDPAY